MLAYPITVRVRTAYVINLGFTVSETSNNLVSLLKDSPSTEETTQDTPESCRNSIHILGSLGAAAALWSTGSQERAAKPK